MSFKKVRETVTSPALSFNQSDIQLMTSVVEQLLELLQQELLQHQL